MNTGSLPPVNPEDYGLPRSSAVPSSSASLGPQLNFVQSRFADLGLVTPLSRGTATAAVVSTLLFATQPSFMFDEYGAKDWSLFATEEDDKSGFTPIPWYVAAAGLGAFVALAL